MPRGKTSVLILYNEPQPADRGAAFAESEEGVLDEVKAVARALDKLRIPHRMVSVRRFGDLPAVLAASDEPVVFNLVEGFWQDAGWANLVPGVIAGFGKACTGNDSQGLLLSFDKWQSKALLAAAGLPVPEGLVVRPGRPIPVRDLFEGPYMVKPVRADASEGIDETSIVQGRGKALREAVQRVHDQQGQSALIERYIEGRELNVSVISRNGDLEVLPMAEIDFSAFEAGRPRIVGYEAKWLADSFEFQHTPRIIPVPLPNRQAQRIRDVAVAACRALRCVEYSRVDLRLDRAGRPYILEVNANPDITPDDGFAAALEAGGISYKAFIKLAVENAVRRNSQSTVHGSRPRRHRGKLKAEGRRPTEIDIRWCRHEDRQVVLSLLADTGFFRPDEIDVARELLDAALAEGPEGHYQSFVARTLPQDTSRTAHEVPETVGWVCFGPTPCTMGTWDIYWLGVASAWQDRGVGRALTAFAEQTIRERGGRLFVVETSSRESYGPTRRFYETLGYREAGRIPDFYGSGDHRVIFIKTAEADEGIGLRLIESQGDPSQVLPRCKQPSS